MAISTLWPKPPPWPSHPGAVDPNQRWVWHTRPRFILPIWEHASAGAAQRYVRLAPTRRTARTWQLNTGAAANGDIALIACFASSWTSAMVRRWHADPSGFLRPWNEVPALIGSAHPPRPPRPAPAWSSASWGSIERPCLSKLSRDRLQGVHPDLVRVVERAIQTTT